MIITIIGVRLCKQIFILNLFFIINGNIVWSIDYWRWSNRIPRSGLENESELETKKIGEWGHFGKPT